MVKAGGQGGVVSVWEGAIMRATCWRSWNGGMSKSPEHPKLYHITHVDNLQSIVADGVLLSDAAIAARGGPVATIGMSGIKRRRLGLPVPCYPGDHVGDYVPFYLCPRSIMLFVIDRANHPELTYRGGQGPIVHLEADLVRVVEWAQDAGRRWAFSLSNAGAAYAEFRADLTSLEEIDWDAVGNPDFRSPEVKEGKQAEFLVHQDFPWELVDRIGVVSDVTWRRVQAAVGGAWHRPGVEIRPEWYYELVEP